ncbi:transcription factor Cys6 [Metarhizium brunneum]
MPGGPSGRGCQGCRKRKKKCDLAQPSCSRCLRYGIRCVGSGERVYRFKNATVTGSVPVARTAVTARSRGGILADGQIKLSPPRPLGNELTSTTGAFISTLQISDPKFSVLGFGPFLEDVPCRLGRSKILRTAAMAFSSAVTAVHSRQATVQALKDYGTALACMRSSFINDPSQVGKAETLCGVYLLLLSQYFLGGHNDECLVHLQGLLYILNNQAARDYQDPFSSKMVDLASIIAITECVIDPRVQIKRWHADLRKTSYYGPLNNYSVVDIRSTNLTVANLIDLPMFLQEPEYHLVQLRSSYDLMRVEVKKIIPITKQLHEACATSLDMNYYKGYTICESSICVLHTLMAIIRKTLLVFHPYDSTLKEHEESATNVVLASAARAWNFRPLGTTYMPKTLCLLWATTDDPNMKAKVEDMIDNYREDFRGDSWTKIALFFEQRFERLRKRVQTTMPYHLRQDTTSPGSTNDETESFVEV